MSTTASPTPPAPPTLVIRRVLALTATALTAGTILGACAGDDGDGAKGANSSATDAALTEGTGAAQPTDSADGRSGTTCHTADLAITVSDADGAAGSSYRHLEFTNTSDAECTLSGYPGVSLIKNPPQVDITENSTLATQIGAAAERDADREDPPVVTLAPGGTARADLKITNPGVYGDQCSVTSADALKIYPPDERTPAVVVADGLVGCSGEKAPVPLSISVVRS